MNELEQYEQMIEDQWLEMSIQAHQELIMEQEMLDSMIYEAQQEQAYIDNLEESYYENIC